MSGGDPTQEAAVALARTLAGRLTGWDEPAHLAAVHLDVSDDGSLCWRLSTTHRLDGHPFDALMGRYADADAVGAALACEGYIAATGTGPGIDEDLAAHAGADGYAEIRDVLVVLRDGTAGHVVSVRDGGTHLVDPHPAGRVPAALARHLGRPSGLPAAGPHDVAARLVLGTATEVATGRGVPVMDAVVELAGEPAGWIKSMPVPHTWLAVAARLAGDLDDELTWGMVHERLCALPRLGHHLLVHAVTPARHCTRDVPATLRWCDPAMVGHLFDTLAPAWPEIELALAPVGGNSADAIEEMVALARTATGPAS